MNAQQAPAIPTTNIKLMNAAASLLFGLVLLAAVAALLWWFARLPMFALSGIRVTGQTAHSSVYVLRNQVVPQLQGNFFSVNLDQVRSLFEEQPWVRRAVVRREFPSRLSVHVEEHQEVALWGSQEQGYRLIDRYGEVFDASPEEASGQEMPELNGPDELSPQVLLMYGRLEPLFAPVQSHITALTLEPRGNWTLVLNRSTTLNLAGGTEQELAARIQQFIQTIDQVAAQYGRSFADLQYADLRYKTGYAIRLKGITTVDANPSKKT